MFQSSFFWPPGAGGAFRRGPQRLRAHADGGAHAQRLRGVDAAHGGTGNQRGNRWEKTEPVNYNISQPVNIYSYHVIDIYLYYTIDDIMVPIDIYLYYMIVERWQYL